MMERNRADGRVLLLEAEYLSAHPKVSPHIPEGISAGGNVVSHVMGDLSAVRIVSPHALERLLAGSKAFQRAQGGFRLHSS